MKFSKLIGKAEKLADSHAQGQPVKSAKLSKLQGLLSEKVVRYQEKLDTTEVIYTRPITNGEYVIGKTMGILVLFIGLVIIALVMALIFNIIRPDVPIVWQAYLYYPLLINLPTMVFILGLSFILMISIKNSSFLTKIECFLIYITLFNKIKSFKRLFKQ